MRRRRPGRSTRPFLGQEVIDQAQSILEQGGQIVDQSGQLVAQTATLARPALAAYPSLTVMGAGGLAGLIGALTGRPLLGLGIGLLIGHLAHRSLGIQHGRPLP